MRPTNLFAGIPRSLPDELVETLLESGAARIERIVSRGHSSPEGQWYDQPEHEWVALLQGSARLAFDDGSPDIELLPGDFLFIPARRRHRVAWTDSLQDNVWLAIFLPA
jgi:cupin 2 domain-containing protein